MSKINSASLSVSIWGRDLHSETSEHALEIKQMLQELGLPLHPIGSANSTHFLSFEHSGKHLALHSAVPIEKRLLIVSEPPVVRPDEHKSQVKRRYGRVVYVSPKWVTESTDLFWQPGFIRPSHMSASNVGKELTPVGSELELALINENKFSFVPASNYTLRQKLINTLGSNSCRLSVAGLNWDRSLRWYLVEQLKAFLICLWAHRVPAVRLTRFPLRAQPETTVFLGQVPNAIEFLGKHPVALVIENDSSYLSEKLFHALLAGAAPIYVGPPLELFGLSSKIVIQCGSSVNQLAQLVGNLTIEEVNECRARGRMLVEDPYFIDKWSVAVGYRRLAEIVSRFLEPT